MYNKLSDLNEKNCCENRKRSRTSFEVVDFRIVQKIVNIQIELQKKKHFFVDKTNKMQLSFQKK